MKFSNYNNNKIIFINNFLNDLLESLLNINPSKRINIDNLIIESDFLYSYYNNNFHYHIDNISNFNYDIFNYDIYDDFLYNI
jgi:tRNA A37 threonylcarbamoyladenosine dehydratase